jgi:hypothetical protein
MTTPSAAHQQRESSGSSHTDQAIISSVFTLSRELVLIIVPLRRMFAANKIRHQFLFHLPHLDVLLSTPLSAAR